MTRNIGFNYLFFTNINKSYFFESIKYEITQIMQAESTNNKLLVNGKIAANEATLVFR